MGFLKTYVFAANTVIVNALNAYFLKGGGSQAKKSQLESNDTLLAHHLENMYKATWFLLHPAKVTASTVC